MNSLQRKQSQYVSFLFILLVTIFIAGCSPSSSEANATSDPNKVTDIVWEWEALKTNSGEVDEGGRPIQETTAIPNPENYTLILREDGTFSGTADCNQISGTYSTESGYSFTIGPSTMAFCGEASLDQQYLDLLGRVVAGGPDGAGGFALETPAGGERMEFRNGGAAPVQ